MTQAQMMKRIDLLYENLKILKRELRKKSLSPETLDEYRERYVELLNAKIGESFKRK